MPLYCGGLWLAVTWIAPAARVFAHQHADGRRGRHVGIEHRAAGRQQGAANRIDQHPPVLRPSRARTSGPAGWPAA